MPSNQAYTSIIPYRPLLALITGIMVFRVATQFLLQYYQPPALPSFDLWQSSNLPYSTQLILQCLIVAAMISTTLLLPGLRTYPRTGKTLILLGWVYATAISLRLIIGVFELSPHPWFDDALPSAFHFLLAAFVAITGSSLANTRCYSHTTKNSTLARYLSYPIIILGSQLLLSWQINQGSPLLFASYIAVLCGAFGVLLHETFSPLRHSWRPLRKEILTDSLFLTVVQIGLPAILKGLALALIIGLADRGIEPLARLWPHDLPVLIQVGLMLVLAEFFRYWTHRTLHKNPTLWKLHAVHHAANKLYTVNVGRFHPLDKSIQFLGDTLPFLLLGVSPDVFATYFVFYAINGFFQHSNADIRLGPLNWIIAGPELHRWHHSAKVKEAHSNYGNNLIIWDTIFSTRYLPANRDVGQVGISNTEWPANFLSQMTAPFTTSTEKPTTKPQSD